jgi:hypothetical protein
LRIATSVANGNCGCRRFRWQFDWPATPVANGIAVSGNPARSLWHGRCYFEVMTQSTIAKWNSFVSAGDCSELLALSDRVGAMLYRLHESLD